MFWLLFAVAMPYFKGWHTEGARSREVALRNSAYPFYISGEVWVHHAIFLLRWIAISTLTLAVLMALVEYMSLESF
jgi:hypothetical protein